MYGFFKLMHIPDLNVIHFELNKCVQHSKGFQQSGSFSYVLLWRLVCIYLYILILTCLWLWFYLKAPRSWTEPFIWQRPQKMQVIPFINMTAYCTTVHAIRLVRNPWQEFFAIPVISCLLHCQELTVWHLSFFFAQAIGHMRSGVYGNLRAFFLST
jgi:hypothetical protein